MSATPRTPNAPARNAATPRGNPKSPAARPKPKKITGVTWSGVSMPMDIVKWNKMNTFFKNMEDPNIFLRSSLAHFKLADKDRNGVMSFPELRLMNKTYTENLNTNACTPTLLRKFLKDCHYEGDNIHLNSTQFSTVYGRMHDWYKYLLPQKYYPVDVNKNAVDLKKTIAFTAPVNHVKLEGCTQGFFKRPCGNGKSITDLYTLGKKLGEGAFGTGYLATNKALNKKRCLKKIQKKGQSYLDIIQEAEVLKKMDHVNVIKIYEILEDADYVWIEQELADGGELEDYLGKYSEAWVASVMQQILKGVIYCHEHNIVHQDLKPANILVTRFQKPVPGTKWSPPIIKIIDFGMATSGSTPGKVGGTPTYMAREQWQDRPCLKSDSFACGVILFELLTGKLPWGTDARCRADPSLDWMEEIEQEICHGDNFYGVGSKLKGFSALAAHTCMRLMCKDLALRFSPQNILKHKDFALWLKKAPSTPMSVEDHKYVINRMMKFNQKSDQISAAVYNIVAHQLDGQSAEVMKIVNIFNAIDNDGNGSITPSELNAYLSHSGQFSKENIKSIVKIMDVNNDGNIHISEFVSACYRYTEKELREIKKAFDHIDRNGDGRISVDEFRALAVLSISDNITPADTMAALKRMDANGDGFIDWNEFKAEFLNGNIYK